MTRMRVAGNGIALILLAVLFSPASPAAARGAAPQEQKPAYTIAEYNAYQAARTEKDPQAQIKLLDDFVNKFPEFLSAALHLPAVLSRLQSAEELSQGD